MKPKAFLRGLESGRLAAGYLLIGAETFFRDRCRAALRKAVLGDDDAGFVEIDLKEQSPARLLDETRSLSLFASSRLILGLNAEAALPKGPGGAADSAAARALADYFADPTPGVVVAFECAKLDRADRDDKAKIDRVLKFFSAVPETVEMDRLTPEEALLGCQALARKIGLEIEPGALAELVDMLGADMARLETELNKLALYRAAGQPVTSADVRVLVPEARQSGVFELTDALADRDGSRALEILDTLAKTGAYWPMQITFLASLFRQALAVKELGGRNPQQVQNALGKRGIRLWPSRTRQLMDAAGKFSQSELEGALGALYEADRDLRRERPDDRLIMEALILRLTTASAGGA